MKELLSRAGRPFIERNVEEDHAAYRELVALGFRTVPVTVIGSRSVKGHDPVALEQALRAHDAR